MICSCLHWAWRGHSNKQLAISKQACPPGKGQTSFKANLLQTHKQAQTVHAPEHINAAYIGCSIGRLLFGLTLMPGLSIIITANTNKHDYSHGVKAAGLNISASRYQTRFKILPRMREYARGPALFSSMAESGKFCGAKSKSKVTVWREKEVQQTSIAAYLIRVFVLPQTYKLPEVK